MRRGFWLAFVQPTMPAPLAGRREVIQAGLCCVFAGLASDYLHRGDADEHRLDAGAGEPDVEIVRQCGNGARCFVRFVHDQGLTDKRQIRVETLKGIIEPRLEADGNVTVDMGEPRFLPAEIPFLADDDVIIHLLDVADETLETTVVSMGNPHAVQVVDNVDTHPVGAHGPLIERHERFPKRVNAGFMQIIGRHSIKLRVYERGSGETLACGTGACAAAVAGIRRGLLDSPVRVTTRGGDLNIAWGGPGRPVLMTGPAVTVFTGEIEL